jgi:hypothetical protein
MSLSLSQLAVLMGSVVASVAFIAVLKPAAFTSVVRGMPRSLTWGYFFIAVSTGWFLYYLQQESVSDFAAYKRLMLIGFTLLGVFTCVFLNDYLGARGFAVFLLLLSKSMIDAARWADTSWRLVMVIWAYGFVFLGMWLTVSPYRMRDIVNWMTSTPGMVRLTNGFRLAFGLLVVILGLTVYR